MVITVNPGVGEPSGIQGMSASRSAKAAQVRGAYSIVVGARSFVTDSVWSGKARDAFLAGVDRVVPDLGMLAEGLEVQAAALHVYAGEVAQIKDAQLRLQVRRESAQAGLLVATRLQVSPLEQQMMRLSGSEGEAALARARRVEETIAAETALLRQVDSEWAALVARRRRADDVCVAALSGTGALGKMAPFLGGGLGTVSSARLLRMLDGLSATDLAILLVTHPDLPERLAGAAPEDVAAWWSGMNGPASGAPSAAQAALIAVLPAVIGNLGGVAYWARDAANRITLEHRIAAAKKAVADTKAALPLGGIGGTGMGGTNWATDDYFNATHNLKALRSIKKALEPDASGIARALVSLSDDSPPLAAVSVGDLDTAANVTYAVPGMGTDTSNMRGWATTAQRVHGEQTVVTDHGLDSAVVAWIGYETPPVPLSPDVNFDVFDDERAKTGGAQLARDIQGWRAVRSDGMAPLNVIAHSYGTTTAAYALAQQDLNVASFVALGSAGMPTSVASADELHADRVYAGQAQNVLPGLEGGDGDQWAWIGRSGSGRSDPMHPDFGAIRFGTNGNEEKELHGVDDHSIAMTAPDHGYLDNETESLRNSALATTNQPERMTLHREPGLTETQRRIMEAPSRFLPRVR